MFLQSYRVFIQKNHQNDEMVDMVGLDSIAKMLIGSNPIFDIK